MRLNPFEHKENKLKLEDVLETTDFECFKIKKEYTSILNENYLDYEALVKCIDPNIEWHILDTGGYQGDYWYFALYNSKVYFVNIGYGSCSGCDSLLACSNIKDIKELQDDIKRNIREFDDLKELVEWIVNSTEWWISEKDKILNYIKEEFNFNFEIIQSIIVKEM